jgi:antirestriction protein ArdC
MMASRKKQPRVDVYQAITDTLIEKMGDGDLPPWRRTWTAAGAPKNLASGKAYRGINLFLLLLSPFTCPYWLTFKQAKAKKGHVRKGEKGTRIIFWKMLSKENADGKTSTFPLLRTYTVFNVEQCEGIEAPAVEGDCGNDDDPIPACEAIAAGYPLPRPDMQLGKPSYAPFFDTVRMPRMDEFMGAAEYYSTLFHELAHSTGHKDRLDRDLMGTISFGSEDYSREELVAEFTASFLCADAGISPSVLENQAAYLKGWRKALRGDPKMVVTAAQRAQKAAEYILGNREEAPAE